MQKDLTIDEKLDVLEATELLNSQEIIKIEKHLDNIESDVGTLKSDVGTLKFDVGTLKADMNSVKTELSDLSNRFNSFDTKLDKIAKLVTVSLGGFNKRLRKLESRETVILQANLTT